MKEIARTVQSFFYKDKFLTKSMQKTTKNLTLQP